MRLCQWQRTAQGSRALLPAPGVVSSESVCLFCASAPSPKQLLVETPRHQTIHPAKITLAGCMVWCRGVSTSSCFGDGALAQKRHTDFEETTPGAGNKASEP